MLLLIAARIFSLVLCFAAWAVQALDEIETWTEVTL